jgi:type IV pilus assembly protein PilM
MRLTLPNPTLALPAALQRRTVTLNIEAQSIRVLTVRGENVMSWQEIPLDAGMVKEGVIADPDGVGAALKTALDSPSMSGGRLIASITGFRSIARVLELPKMKPEMLEEAVGREAKREMPVPMEDIYLSWQSLDASDGQQRVFALGVPRDILDPLLKAMAVAKRHPSAIDTKPLALARAANRDEAIIADIEPGSADIVLVTGGVPVIMRTVVERAGEPDGVERVERFRDELARTVKFYNDTHRQEPLEPSTPIFLTGSLAESALNEPLEALAQYPVETLLPPLDCPPALPLHTYAVNIGLALKEV